MPRTQHWDQVYSTKGDTEVSWFEPQPTISLELIRTVLPPGGSLIDIGGGASRLVDHLLMSGTVGEITVLDVSAVALKLAQDRLGAATDQVHWIVGDITEISLPGKFDVWNDRAVFHFLTNPADRRRYVELATQAVNTGGHVILGVFAPDGPAKCSGLDVCRYDGEELSREFGPAFQLVRQQSFQHTTPAGKMQSFCFAVLQHIS